MCGVVGYWSKNKFFDESVLLNMAQNLSHRGPDDSGVWIDKDNGLNLAHTRLSILDLSSAGHQPMESACGRYVISYNGEIYNHKEIRKELDNYNLNNWKSSTDTETLLVSLKYWGLEKTLQKINGMFAFAFWDRKNRTLALARDRIGEKPIYYGYIKDVFLFSSEVKAFKNHPIWEGGIDHESLSLYLRFNYIPAPKSIFKDIYKLPPAHYLIIDDKNKKNIPKCYWDISKNKNERTNFDFQNTSEITEELLNKTRESVLKRMISDVPIGSFLSGGLDSTLITAIMQEQSIKPVNTFTVGFFEKQFNEADYAKKVAKILGTNHSEIYLKPSNILDVVPKLSKIYSEPFADSSQIPTYLISKFASENVKVCLSGDGGDELFCGYSRYLKGVDIFNMFNKLPTNLRKFILQTLSYTPFSFWKVVQKIITRSSKPSNLANHITKLLVALKYSNKNSYYLSLISNPKDVRAIMVNSIEYKNFTNELPEINNFREKMMFADLNQYLPDDILTKVDRASMANSLETRAPFLDHNLVEFCLKIPNQYKYKHKKGKWILRELVYNYVPKHIMDRPKKGFDVPIDYWLKGPLKDWAYSLIEKNKLIDDNIFKFNEISKMWQEHQSGKRNWQNNLWSILMFQAWRENF